MIDPLSPAAMRDRVAEPTPIWDQFATEQRQTDAEKIAKQARDAG